LHPEGNKDEGVAGSINLTSNVATSHDGGRVQTRPDVSREVYQELLSKLMPHFNNKRERLARALGLHRSTVDRWLNGNSKPNTSTVLRMRRLIQERRIE
jgi:hypothetical protein